MSAINTQRVILGGLAAGLVINVSETFLNGPVLGAEMEASLARLNLPPVEGASIAMFVVMSFVLGVVLVWLYAAIRPRFGPGPKTAGIAGLATWFLAYCYSSLAMGAMGFFGTGLLTASTLWGLVELLIKRIAITSGQIDRLSIDELEVNRLRVRELITERAEP